MAQNSTKQTVVTKTNHTSLERVSISFEYNESWQDARRAFSSKAAKPAAK